MSPTISDAKLSLKYGGWEDEPEIKMDPRWTWSGFENAATHQTLYVAKHLKVGWELEVFRMYPNLHQIGEVTEGKISLRGTKYYSEDLYSQKKGFWSSMGASKVVKSPVDGKSYVWSHKQVWDTYTMTLVDAETKECIVKTKDLHQKKEPDVLEFSDRGVRMLEFVLLSMLQYRREIYKGNKEFAEAFADAVKG
ncbi:hypothetical protein RQP46_011143 [Phenoliferia psychrophenolica]